MGRYGTLVAAKQHRKSADLGGRFCALLPFVGPARGPCTPLISDLTLSCGSRAETQGLSLCATAPRTGIAVLSVVRALY